MPTWTSPNQEEFHHEEHEDNEEKQNPFLLSLHVLHGENVLL
jgi:hypothetical protein